MPGRATPSSVPLTEPGAPAGREPGWGSGGGSLRIAAEGVPSTPVAMPTMVRLAAEGATGARTVGAPDGGSAAAGLMALAGIPTMVRLALEEPAGFWAGAGVAGAAMARAE